MIQKLIVCFLLLGFAQSSMAQLNDLIKKNVKTATRSHDALLALGSAAKEPGRLWIHIRTKAQEKSAQAINSQLTGAAYNGRNILGQPIQLVTSGPRNTELRIFREQDSADALEILKKLRKDVPSAQLKNLSAQYRSVEWIKPGHFELWLAPEVIIPEAK
jgi:hypothetical protein